MRSHRSAGADSDATSPLLAWTAVMGCRGSSGMSGVWAVCAVFGGLEAVAELAGSRLCPGAMSLPDALPAPAAVCRGGVRGGGGVGGGVVLVGCLDGAGRRLRRRCLRDGAACEPEQAGQTGPADEG